MGHIEDRLSTLATTPLLGQIQGGGYLLAYTRERLIFLSPDEDRFIERQLIRRVYTPEAGRLGFLDGQGVLLLLIASSSFSPDELRAFLHAMAANQSYGMRQTTPVSPPPPPEEFPSASQVTAPEDLPVPPPAPDQDRPPLTVPVDPPVDTDPVIWGSPPQVSSVQPPDESAIPPSPRSPARWQLIYRGLALLVVVLGVLTVLEAQSNALTPAMQVWILLSSISLGTLLWRFNQS